MTNKLTPWPKRTRPPREKQWVALVIFLFVVMFALLAFRGLL